MTEPGISFGQTESAEPPAARLGFEAGILAGRLAQLLSQSTGTLEGPAAAQHRFLQEFFAEATSGRAIAIGSTAFERRPASSRQPIDRLCEAFVLSPFELDLVLLAGLAEEHEGLAAVLRSLHPRAEPRATVGLAARLFCQSPVERRLLREVIEDGVLSRVGLLEVPGDAPFFERSLVLADCVWTALHGVDAWPASIEVERSPLASHGLSKSWLDSEPARTAALAIAGDRNLTLLIVGETLELAVDRATAIVRSVHARGTVLSAATGWTSALERLAAVHALARGVTPIVRIHPADGRQSGELPAFSSYPGCLVFCARDGVGAARGSRPVLSVHVERLRPNERRALWAQALPEVSPDELALRYTLEAGFIERVAFDARQIAALRGASPKSEDVAASVRTRTGASASPSLSLTRPKAGLKRLVLAPDRLAQLREAIDRLKGQSQVLDDWGFLADRAGARGVRMLFVGPPGTGKTLSAEVMASELGVDLLVVDISRVVSKWLGETEKNLSAVFDVAERAQAVLFFDEADALFGKRTEVSDAHDRYANLETAYLLSRLERFEGLAILSSNLRQNIDSAFLRRLEFVVDFQEPSLAEREALWRCHLPERAPLASDVNLPELSSIYPLVGGYIRNAAASAAFLAAAEGVPIRREHLVRAIRREYQKSGKAFPGVPTGMSNR